ncbi:MAG: hypothetical protein ACRDTF_07525 [Pseudonocardiaceae bacterium]
MTASWHTTWLRVRHLGQRIGVLSTRRQYADYIRPTGWSGIRQHVAERRHRAAVLSGRVTTPAAADDIFVGQRARWLGNRDIGLPTGTEGTVTEFTLANDIGRRCYRIAFDNDGPVIHTYLPAPWDIELIPTDE